MIRSTLALVAALVATMTANASPIVYQFIPPGATVPGTITQPNGNPSNPVGAVYYSFFANAGAVVTVTGARVDSGFDMSFWLFSGLFADTTNFGPSFDAGDAPFAQFRDDEISHPGPFGDPLFSGPVPFTGFYTVAVTNFLSDGTGPPFNFTLNIQGNLNIPEPATLAVFGGIALAGAFGYRRRKATATV